MLSSISPFGERARAQSYPVTAASFIVASTLAGALLGFVLGGAGVALSTTVPWPIAIALVALTGLACDTRLFRLRVPGPRRQVNEDWLVTYRGWVYGAGFGAQLGSAFSTIVSASATWVAFACCLWSGSAPAGAVIGGIFGVVRAVPLLANARIRDPRRLRRLLAGMERLRSPITRLVLVMQAALVVLLLASIGVQS